MRSWIINLVLTLILLVMKYKVQAVATSLDEKNVARDMFEKGLLRLMEERKVFMDGFNNATALLQKDYGFSSRDLLDGKGEGRGRRKKMRQMNRTLIAIVMAYTLKFMFLIPTLVGTLALLKFTTGLAGFFYALFAAVLGLDHHREH